MNKLAAGTEMFLVEINSSIRWLTVTSAGTVCYPTNYDTYIKLGNIAVDNHMLYRSGIRAAAVCRSVQTIFVARIYCTAEQIPAASNYVTRCYKRTIAAHKAELLKLLNELDKYSDLVL